MWSRFERGDRVKLAEFGFVFEMDEPNMWDVVRDDFLSSYGYHVPAWPNFISWSCPTIDKLHFSCIFIYGLDENHTLEQNRPSWMKA